MNNKEILVEFTTESDPGVHPMTVYTDGTLVNSRGELSLWKEHRSSSSGKIYIAVYDIDKPKTEKHRAYLIDYCAKKIIRALVERTLIGADDA